MTRRKSKKRKSKKRKSRSRQRRKSRTRLKSRSKMTEAQLIKAKQIDLNKKLLLFVDTMGPVARKGNIKKIKNLLKAGADPNTQDKNGNTPLTYILMIAKNSVQEYNTRFLVPAGGPQALGWPNWQNPPVLYAAHPPIQEGAKHGEYYLFHYKNRYKLLYKFGKIIT